MISSGQAQAKVAGQTATQVCKLDFSNLINYDNVRRLVFIAELWQGDRFVTRQTAAFCPIKHLALVDPAISADLHQEAGRLSVELTAKSLALLVELSLPNSDAVFSDNYFNLPAGRTAHISCPLPAGWTQERAKKELHLRSVYDSYSD